MFRGFKMARPKKYTKKYLKEVAILINEYVDKSAIPVLAECAFELGHHRQFFYEHDDCPEFLDAVKRLLAKKEFRLEVGALSGNLNASMAIFSLKQMGWSDKHEHSLPGGKNGNGPSKITIEWE